MGGEFTTGSPADEFNVRHDPEAAAVVLAAGAQLGIPVTVYPLDLFYAPTVTRAQARELNALGAGPRRSWPDAWSPSSATGSARTRRHGNAGAVCAVIDPESLTTQEQSVFVDLAHRRGSTVVVESSSAARRGPLTHRRRPSSGLSPSATGPRYAGLWLDAVR